MRKVAPVIFENKSSVKLFGMLHQPTNENRNGIGVILLPPGVKARVGPHRLYRNIANQLTDLGYVVLRFDFHGIGDSEGDITDEFLADYYGSVSLGRHVDDTICAIDWLQRTVGISSFLLAGLCGGAITGILAGSRDNRVAGLIGLGLPVVLDGTNIDKSKYITKGELKKLGEGYIKKLFKPKAWLRFLTFRSDYRIIIKAVKQIFGSEKNKAKPAAVPSPAANQQNEQEDNYNPMFDPAFFRMLENNQKILLVFSGADRLAWEFNEKFVSKFGAEVEAVKDRYEFHIIKEANHILSDKKWQKEMLEITTSWLDRNSFTLQQDKKEKLA